MRTKAPDPLVDFHLLAQSRFTRLKPERRPQMTTIEHQPAQPVSQDWDWQLFAACRGLDVEIFYHPAGERRRDKTARINQAKQICRHCPVINDCAAWALKTREPYGVWGGMSEDERATVLGVRSLRYPAPAPAPGTTR